MKKIIIVVLILVISVFFYGCKSSDYNKALEFQESGDYTSALAIYEELGDYKDSASQAEYCGLMIESIQNFDDAVATLEQKNAELDSAIETAQALIDGKETALDETLIPELETAITQTRAEKLAVPEMLATADEINTQTDDITSADYSAAIKNLSEKQLQLENSIAQYALVNAPAESYIIECLQDVDNIVDLAAVTEDNDPNGNLNKAGGYTSTVFFSSDLVDQSQVYGTTLIEKATNAGGSIEVYTTAEDAEKRNEYLSAFDGTAFASGSHTVIGTVVVRTSNELTASNQKMIEENIINRLIKLD